MFIYGYIKRKICFISYNIYNKVWNEKSEFYKDPLERNTHISLEGVKNSFLTL